MRFVNAAGFVVDADEVVWVSQNTENSGGGFTVQLKNNAIVKIPYPQGVALTHLLTESNVDADAHKIVVDPNGKQILVFHGVKHSEFLKLFDALSEWAKDENEHIFAIRLNDGQNVELIKLEE